MDYEFVPVLFMLIGFHILFSLIVCSVWKTKVAIRQFLSARTVSYDRARTVSYIVLWYVFNVKETADKFLDPNPD